MNVPSRIESDYALIPFILGDFDNQLMDVGSHIFFECVLLFAILTFLFNEFSMGVFFPYPFVIICIMFLNTTVMCVYLFLCFFVFVSTRGESAVGDVRIAGELRTCSSTMDMCWCLNSHYFHIVGDGHQPNNSGLYTHYKDSLLKVEWPSPIVGSGLTLAQLVDDVFIAILSNEKKKRVFIGDWNLPM